MMKTSSGLTLGAVPQKNGYFHFCVWAPFVNTMALEIINAGNKVKYPMEKNDDGYFSCLAKTKNGSHYHYLLNYKTPLPDPASRYQPDGVFGPSQTVAFNPAAKPWQGLAWEDYIIYELHVGAFTKQGTFAAIIPYLDELKKLGITAIELMPINQFSGSRNWGYDGVFSFAVQNTYGGPYQLYQFVQACHQRNIAVVLDVVYNHFGPEGNNFANFGPYFTDKYKTPWGYAINFDGPYADAVRQYFLENAFYWFSTIGIDALRLDALHAIYDQSAYPFILELADKARTWSKQLGREVYLVGESDLGDARLILPKKQGGFDLTAQWNDEFHHALHTILTKEQHHYYQDFGKLNQLAKACKGNYVYTGEYSPFRKRRFGSNCKNLGPRKFVVFSQNHDQIGNRLRGDRLTTHLNQAQLKLAAAFVLLSPSIPLMFMGEEYGELNPFYYFTSHSDKKLIQAVRIGRQREYSDLNTKHHFPDPNNYKTFLQSKLNHALKRKKHHKELLTFYHYLMKIRQNEQIYKKLNKKNIRVEVIDDKGLMLQLIDNKSNMLILLGNFSNTIIDITLPKVTKIKLMVDSTKPSGKVQKNIIQKYPQGSRLEKTNRAVNLEPYQFLLYRGDQKS